MTDQPNPDVPAAGGIIPAGALHHVGEGPACDGFPDWPPPRRPTTTIHLPEETPMTDRPWRVAECADESRDNCPCIVAQDAPQDWTGETRYIADAETPELAAQIAAEHNRNLDPASGSDLRQRAAEPDRCPQCWCGDCGGLLAEHTDTSCGCDSCQHNPSLTCRLADFLPDERIRFLAEQLGPLLSSHLGPKQQRRTRAVAHAAHHALHDYDYPKEATQ